LSKVYRDPQVVKRRPSNLIQLEKFVESWKDDTGIDWDALKSFPSDGQEVAGLEGNFDLSEDTDGIV
jgi:hypothetical protein